jgi:hypothetical protein
MRVRTSEGRTGQRVLRELHRLRGSGLSHREIAAIELGVGEVDYLVWEIRPFTDDAFLADALGWGDDGTTIQRWMDVGEAMGRERRRFARTTWFGRIKARLAHFAERYLVFRPNAWATAA